MREKAVTFWCDATTTCSLPPVTVSEEHLDAEDRLFPAGWVQVDIWREAGEVSEHYTVHAECLDDWLRVRALK